MLSLWKTKLVAGIQTKVGMAVLAVLLVGGAGTALAVIAAHGNPSASSNNHCGQHDQKDQHDQQDQKDQDECGQNNQQDQDECGQNEQQDQDETGQNNQTDQDDNNQCDQSHQGESHLVGTVASSVDLGTASFVLILV